MSYNILQTLDSVSEFSRGCPSVKTINFNKKEKAKKLKEKRNVMSQEEAEYAKYIGVDVDDIALDDDDDDDGGNDYNVFSATANYPTTHFTNNYRQERRRERGGMGRGSWLKSGVGSNYNCSAENNFSRPLAPSNRQFHNDRVISQQLRGLVESVSNEEIENRFALKFRKNSPVTVNEEEAADSVCSSSDSTSRPIRDHPDKLIYVPPHLRPKQPDIACDSKSRSCSLASDHEHAGNEIYMSDENDTYGDYERPKTPLDEDIASKVNSVYDPIPDFTDTVVTESDDGWKIGENIKFVMKSKQLESSSRSINERPTRNALLNGLLKKIAEENNNTKNEEVLLNNSSSSTPVNNEEELKCNNSINFVSSDSSNRCLSRNSTFTNSSCCSSPNYYTADSSASSKNSSFVVENVRNNNPPKIHPTIFTLADYLPYSNSSSSLNPLAKPFDPSCILDSGKLKPFRLDAADFPPLGI